MTSQNAVAKFEKNLSIWECNETLAQIKQIFGEKLTQSEFNILVQMGRATGLNPFLREIWAVKYGNNPAQIFIGRDGYRKSAQTNPAYDYHHVDAIHENDEFYFDMVNGEVHHRYNLNDRGKLLGAYCLVKKKNATKPTFVSVDIKEYNLNQSVWKDKPSTMIKKVAEAQGLRMAFQELFASTYDESEIEEKQFDRKRKVDELNAKLEESSIIEGEVINQETGEIIEISFHKIKEKILTAKNIDELVEAVDLVNSLTSLDEKKELMTIYRDKQKELKG